ncbi:double-strand break repair protein AddB [Tabrizicola sp. BL-A-41-H6]|uniref:double-strand break repair protein AddB n=1 Tax=Tabrizicola sp. BL-A-41-H6 TaxID=3421107 RepID=UPI003D675B12
MAEGASGLFGLPPGVDFPAELVAGLRSRMAGKPPEAMARVTLVLNTQRMRRRVTEILTEAGCGFLPRLLLVTEIGTGPEAGALPTAISPLQRRLDLAVLLDRLTRSDAALFPQGSLFDLADSLAGLIDEMQGEAVPPARIAALNVADHSAHWARTQAFLGIVAEALQGDAPDAEARQRLAVEALIARWRAAPPTEPVIVAGSTGSRGTTALLMQAVARLPSGAVVLPGFDFDLPDAVWAGMGDALTAEDHPQFRFRRLLDGLDLGPAAVARWTAARPADAERNRLISLSLRPAPVTDQWLTDGPALPDLMEPTRNVTLIEAPSERAEATAIALILREAAETGTRAALISPDRNLTRRVAAVLDRWGIRPDDSAGHPLALSAPGRLLRHVADLFGRKLTSEALLTVLKHPLAFSGTGRGRHLMLTRELELHIRRNGPAFPDANTLTTWVAARNSEHAAVWAEVLAGAVTGHENVSNMALPAHVLRLRTVAEALARGFEASGAGELWQKEAGIEALAVMNELEAITDPGLLLSPAQFASLLANVLQRDVREAVLAHPGIMVWGTLEARVQGADLVILGGLNEGVWPAQPPPDPWLNRQMRKEAGLLLPERRIGLSAHDYQQAIAAQRVVISRPLRNADAETVPSRWLNRLTNLMEGLEVRSGKAALAKMRARGEDWLALAAAVEAPFAKVEPAPRPSPRPPVAARPAKLSLTRIETLIRDPYAIYAGYILRLRKLNPLRPEPDPRLRGEVLHEVLEHFVERSKTEPPTRALLIGITDDVLGRKVAWPSARAVWRARLARAADAFIAFSTGTGGIPVEVETEGSITLEEFDFTLFGTPDRIDLMPDGTLHLIDYKTGAPPSEEQQKVFAKQLLLAAAMAENGGFAKLGPTPVSKISYVGVKDDLKIVETSLEREAVAEVWAGLHRLIGAYARKSQGYTSRRAMFETNFASDYDHLARFGEWDLSHTPKPEDVG